MFLRATKRKKDGKEHRYWSVVENLRNSSGSVYQRTLLYLGELNDSQHGAWTKALEVFNVDSGHNETRSLFPADRTPPPGDTPALSLHLDQYHLSHPRQYGACWLSCELWRQLGLDQFWANKLPVSREGTDWAGLLLVSTAYRLIAPGSEWRCHRQWYERSAMGDLLGPSFHWGGKDQLYQVLDRLLKHRGALFTHLQERWKDLFGARYEILLYDLTSTYVEGQAAEIPKAQFGHSRDHRTDCRQVVIALVVTPEGFPLAYEVMPGNTSDRTTLRAFLAKVQEQYGQAQRVWIMDRGIPTEEVLAEMRAADPPIHYLVGTPRARVRQTRGQWENLPWQQVQGSVEVKLFREGEELMVVAKSGGRQAKENAMRRKRLAALLWTLRALRRESSRDRLLLRLGAAKSKAGRAASLVEIQLPAAQKGKAKKTQQVQPGSFKFSLRREALQEAELYDGHYLLRSNLSDKEPVWLWKLYMLLVEIEAVFKSFKNDLGLRPIYHSTEGRVEAHIFICFLAYCLQVTLRQRLNALAPGLTPRAVIETLAGVQMLDLEMPTSDGRWLVMSRYTQPDKAVELLLARLKLQLPDQPPPRLSAERKITT
jgi:Transposase DDE domain